MLEVFPEKFCVDGYSPVYVDLECTEMGGREGVQFNCVDTDILEAAKKF